MYSSPRIFCEWVHFFCYFLQGAVEERSIFLIFSDKKMTCEPTQQNTAVYLQGVTVTTSSNIANEYFVTSTLPSAAPNRRVWSFMAQGTFTGPLSVETPSSFILDYTVAQ